MFICFLWYYKQSRLNKGAAKKVEELLPKSAQNDLGSVCVWADQIKFHYPWSRPLHFINTPDVCNYKFSSKSYFSLGGKYIRQNL